MLARADIDIYVGMHHFSFCFGETDGGTPPRLASDAHKAHVALLISWRQPG
jgi:hypothetical protein